MSPRSLLIRFAAILCLMACLPSLADDGAIPARREVPSALSPAGSNQLPAPRTFLRPEQAFKISARRLSDGHNLVFEFTPAPGYYLYRDRIHVTTPQGQPLALEFPPAQSKTDPLYGQVAVYFQPFSAQTGLPTPTPETLQVSWQGCADHGICYPPSTMTLSVPAHAGALTTLSVNGEPVSTGFNPFSANPEEFVATLQNSGVGSNLLLFFVGGLLLALTPCLFPMFPILTGILAGEGKSITRLRALTLSLAYVLGMAVTYAIAGVIAGLSGTLISTALQLPWVQVATALLYVAFALAMFDLYHLQLPLSLQNRLHGLHVHLPSGHHVGAVLMGMLSALIVGPCVAAPLAGALLYIGQTHNLFFGGTALFTLALGMGTPLILVGVSEGMLLPKAGGWMVWVKRVIGVLLLLVAAWQVYPVVHGWIEKPATQNSTEEPYRTIKTVESLDAELARAKTAHQAVMVDFYADWCISCMEMEQKVFPKPEVKTVLSKVLWLRLDVTANGTDARKLLSRYQLLGPPGLIFYDIHGDELPNSRLVGYVEPPVLMEILQKALR